MSQHYRVEYVILYNDTHGVSLGSCQVVLIHDRFADSDPILILRVTFLLPGPGYQALDNTQVIFSFFDSHPLGWYIRKTRVRQGQYRSTGTASCPDTVLTL
jgi:hypothetical protein